MNVIFVSDLFVSIFSEPSNNFSNILVNLENKNIKEQFYKFLSLSKLSKLKTILAIKYNEKENDATQLLHTKEKIRQLNI